LCVKRRMQPRSHPRPLPRHQQQPTADAGRVSRLSGPGGSPSRTKADGFRTVLVYCVGPAKPKSYHQRCHHRAVLKLDGLPEWDWYDISAHIKCTKCGSVGYVDTRPNLERRSQFQSRHWVMCGRVRLANDYSEIKIRLKFAPDAPAPNYEVDYNKPPTMPMLVAMRSVDSALWSFT
jgi:hypothetical protein